jgi:hypothetical protein
MNYTSAMKDVLRLEENIYAAIMGGGKTVRYCMINVFVFGFIHASFSLYFSSLVINAGQTAEPFTLAERAAFTMIGIAVAFFMHAGGSMFLWVFSRGIGGNTAFLPVYFNLGISFIGLWPLAPVLAAVQAGIRGPAALLLLVITSLYALFVIMFGTKSASGLSMAKMSTAMTITIVFVTCFLYLWL